VGKFNGLVDVMRYQTERRHIPVDRKFHGHHHGNARPYIWIVAFWVMTPSRLAED